jgi:hypothetical protein
MSARNQKPHGAQWHKPLVPIWIPSEIPACRGMDTALFYPPRGADAPQEALDACAACVVGEVFQDKALEDEGPAGSQRHGIRGGLTPEERSLLRRRERERPGPKRPRGRPRKNPEPVKEEEAA